MYGPRKRICLTVIAMELLGTSKHRVVVSRVLGDHLQHIPMLNDLARFVKSEDVYSGPLFVTGPTLKAVQHDVVTFGYDSLDFHVFAGILVRHSEEVFDECFLAIRHSRIVLNLDSTRIPFDCLGGPAGVEHQFIKGYRVLFVPFKLV
jgi:hypothetical protein